MRLNHRLCSPLRRKRQTLSLSVQRIPSAASVTNQVQTATTAPAMAATTAAAATTVPTVPTATTSTAVLVPTTVPTGQSQGDLPAMTEWIIEDMDEVRSCDEEENDYDGGMQDEGEEQKDTEQTSDLQDEEEQKDTEGVSDMKSHTTRAPLCNIFTKEEATKVVRDDMNRLDSLGPERQRQYFNAWSRRNFKLRRRQSLFNRKKGTARLPGTQNAHPCARPDAAKKEGRFYCQWDVPKHTLSFGAL